MKINYITKNIIYCIKIYIKIKNDLLILYFIMT